MAQHTAIIREAKHEQVAETSAASVAPPLSNSPLCTVPLKCLDECLLTLFHLDPRLTYLGDRERMRLIVRYFDATFDNRQVGRAYVRLKQLDEQGLLRTRAFDRSGTRSENGPLLAQATRVVSELGVRWGWNDLQVAERQRRLQRVLRLLGHET